MASMRDELDRAIRREHLVELTEARDKAHAQMMAAWSYWVEAKADFSIAAGELALSEYAPQPEVESPADETEGVVYRCSGCRFCRGDLS